MRLELFVLGVIAPGVWPTHNVVERQDARCRCSAVLILIMALVDLGVDVSKPTDTAQIVVRRRANGYEQAQTRSPRTVRLLLTAMQRLSSRDCVVAGDANVRTDLLLR